MTGQCAASLDCDRRPASTGVCWHHQIDESLASRPGPDDHRVSKSEVKLGLAQTPVGLSWPTLWGVDAR